MKALKKYLLILAALTSSILIRAQAESPIKYAKFPLNIAIGNHAVGFPFQNSFKAFNPNLSFGTEFSINKNPKNQIFTSSNLGYILNNVIGNTITFDIGIGYRYRNKNGPFVESAINLGLLNQYHPQDIYIQNEQDRSYDKTKDKGIFASLMGIKMGIGYDFSMISKKPFKLALMHNFFIQTTYFEVMNFPIMPQSTTNIQLTYKFRKS